MKLLMIWIRIHETFDDMDPDPVGKPTSWENNFLILSKLFHFLIFYFYTNQNQQKTCVKCDGYRIWRGGGSYVTLTALVSPSIEYYMSVLFLSINRLF